MHRSETSLLWTGCLLVFYSVALPVSVYDISRGENIQLLHCWTWLWFFSSQCNFFPQCCLNRTTCPAHFLIASRLLLSQERGSSWFLMLSKKQLKHSTVSPNQFLSLLFKGKAKLSDYNLLRQSHLHHLAPYSVLIFSDVLPVSMYRLPFLERGREHFPTEWLNDVYVETFNWM